MSLNTWSFWEKISLWITSQNISKNIVMHVIEAAIWNFRKYHLKHKLKINPNENKTIFDIPDHTRIWKYKNILKVKNILDTAE